MFKKQFWEEVTHHGALLVWEVDTDGAARLGVGHLAVIRGATLTGKALDHGWGKARAVKLCLLHSEAIAQGLPGSMQVLHYRTLVLAMVWDKREKPPHEQTVQMLLV